MSDIDNMSGLEDDGARTYRAWRDGRKDEAVTFVVGPFDDFPTACSLALGADLGDDANVEEV